MQEKEDISEALPDEWKNARDLGQVTLYQNPLSPPCCKLRMIFKFYSVDFITVAGPKKNSEYKKIPVVIIHNRQINDSFIVVKSLARILDGSDLSPELLELEHVTTYELMISLEIAVASSCCSLLTCAKFLPCLSCVGMTLFSCCISTCGAGSFKKKFPDVKPVHHYTSMYTAALGNKSYFHGDSIGVVDLSLCGVLAVFDHAGLEVVSAFLGSHGPLLEWYRRIEPQLPNIFD